MKKDTFLCDTCKKAIDVDANNTGISLFPRCVITQNCRGTLSVVNKLLVAAGQYHNAGTSTDAWVARPLIFDHTQTAPRTRWIIAHNLGSVPILQVFTYNPLAQLVDNSEYTIESENEYQSIIVFNTPLAGVVQCIARQSAQKTVVSTVVAPIATNSTTVSYVNAIIIATTLPSISTVEVTVNANIQVKSTLNEEAASKNDTPWEGVKYVTIGNVRYNVFAISLQGMSGSIGANTSFWIDSINGVAPVARQSFVLLANNPYVHSTDKILTSALDVASMTSANQSKLSLISSTMYCSKSLLSTIYPPMETTNE